MANDTNPPSKVTVIGPSKHTPPLSPPPLTPRQMEILSRIWLAMSSLFAEKWTNKYGFSITKRDEPTGEIKPSALFWAQRLVDLKPTQIERGLTDGLNSLEPNGQGEIWPPNALEFRRLCLTGECKPDTDKSGKTHLGQDRTNPLIEAQEKLMLANNPPMEKFRDMSAEDTLANLRKELKRRGL